MELLLVRHGLPLRVDDAGGPADPALAPAGLEQALALAKWFPEGAIGAVHSSPMRRACETAAPLAERFGLDLSTDEGLAEFDRHLTFYIPLEELGPGDPRWEELVAEWSSPEGEAGRQQFRATAVETIEAIVAAHPSQTVAVVCHGGVVNAYLSHILGMRRTLFFEPAYTSFSRVRADREGHRQLVSANETPHLPQAPLDVLS
jgi:broad specificity phosphatase PhoE